MVFVQSARAMRVSPFLTSVCVLLFCFSPMGHAQNVGVKPLRDTAKANTIPYSYFDHISGRIICVVAGIPADNNSSHIGSFNKGNIYDPMQLIIGRMAGVSITRPGGDPNGSYAVRIRGLNTFTIENRPLIVLDGVVDISLDNVDPNDIESIEVLKSAAATAFYGMRGANGVLIINTKKGKNGKAQLSLQTSMSIDNVGRTFEVLDRDEFVRRGGTDHGSSTDWLEESTKTGVTENVNFSMRQRLNNGAYAISVNYRDIEGIVGPSFRKRLNTSVWLEQRALKNKLKASFRLASTNGQRGHVNPEVFRHITSYNPTAPVFDDVNTLEDGGYFQRDLFDFQNPVALLKNQLTEDEEKTLLMSFGLSYQVNHDIEITGSYTQDRSNLLGGTYYSRTDWQIGRRANGVAGRSTTDSFKEIFDINISLNKRLSNDLNLSGQLGTAFQNRSTEGFSAQVRQFLFDSQTFNNLGAGALRSGFLTGLSSFKTTDRLNSYYGRAMLTYKESLRAFANLRADSYSGFINNKTGLFYGFGMEYDLTSVVDAGRYTVITVRAGYGSSGNLPPNPTLATPFFRNGGLVDLDRDPTTTDDRFVNLIQTWNRNPELKWETTTEFNLGLDFSISSLGLTGAIDYYSRKTEGIIFSEPVLVGAPHDFDPGNFYTASSIFTNFWGISSAGLEVSLNYQNREESRIRWKTGINAIFYDRAVNDRLNSDGRQGFTQLLGFGSFSPGGLSNLVTRSALGQEVGALHAPRFLGQDGANPIVESPNDYPVWEKVGSALPSADVSFHNALSRGNWSLNMLMSGSIGHSLLNVNRWFYESQDPATNTWNTVVTDKSLGLNRTILSDLYVEEASFLRLNHLAISRSFDLKGDTRFTAEIIGQNLFTITRYEGLDPEVRYSSNINRSSLVGMSAGIDGRDLYFTTRTWTLSLRLDF